MTTSVTRKEPTRILSKLSAGYENLRQRFLGPKEAMSWSTEQREFWETNGYLVLPRHFGPELIDDVNNYVDGLWSKKIIPEPMITIDAFIGEPGEHRISVSSVSPAARLKPYKLNDLFMVSRSVQELIVDAGLVNILKAILGDLPVVCNTLNLEYGSQQDYHTDTLYMPAPSGVTGSPLFSNMVATWIALEDCTADAGPLQYYPGSHKIPAFRFSNGGLGSVLAEFRNYETYMQNKVRERGLKPILFEAKKGDVLIWHETLFHGGSPIQNPGKTRKSLVTHYFRAQDVPAQNRKVCKAAYCMKREPHKAPASS